MATLTFSFDTGAVPLSRIVDGMAVTYGYPETIPDPANPGQTIPNTETKAQFARRQIRRIIIEAVRTGEVTIARQTSEQGVTFIDLT